MGKRQFKPGNMLYPVPAVLVTAADREGNSNIFTVAWAGTICTNPPMLSISVRPERHSYHMMRDRGVRGQSDDGVHGVGDRLLRRALRARYR